MTEIIHEEKRTASLATLDRQQPNSLLMAITQIIARQDIDLDRLERFIEMYNKQQMLIAQDEFHSSLAQAKKEFDPIVKTHTARVRSDKANFDYKYADLDDIYSVINPVLAKHGIAVSHVVHQEGNQISVHCVLSRGIYEKAGEPLTFGPDTTGAKNPIQAIVSTISYLKRCTANAALGLSAGEDDDDGKRAASSSPVEVAEDDKKKHFDAISAASTKEEAIAAHKAAWKFAQDARDSQAGSQFTAARDAKIADLRRKSNANSN